MIRRLVAGLIVVGLAVGIWALWPRQDPETTATTLPNAVASTTTTVLATTSTRPITTTSIGSGTHVVETTEEAEAILRDLWFGWFEGIYNQDEDRIREVVGTQSMLDAAKAQFGVMEFTAPPLEESVTFADSELLRSDDACIALWSNLSAEFRVGDTQGVQVARWTGSAWVLVNLWAYKEDLWGADCESSLESF